MKNKLLKIISSVLIFAFIVSASSVFSVATSENAKDNGADVKVIYNRGFDDGWDATNGGLLSGNKVHDMTLGEELTANGPNRYLKMVAKTESGTSCFYQISPPQKDADGATEYVIEFDFRTKGMTGENTTSLLYTRIADKSPDDTILRKNSKGQLEFFWGGTKVIAESMPTDWMHVALKFTANPTDKTITVACYLDDVLVATGTKTISKDSLTHSFFRFQLTSSGGCNIGDAIHFDNIKYYVGTNEITELPADDYGSAIDVTLDKTLPTYDGSDDSSDIKVIYNRTFDDGWEATNGGFWSGDTVHDCGYGEEETLFGINRYLNMVAKSTSGTACYYQIAPPTLDVTGITKFILEFDMRTEGITSANRISLLYTRIDGKQPDDTILRRNENNQLEFYWGLTKAIADMPTDWMHVALSFTVSPDKKTISVSCYLDGELVISGTKTKDTTDFIFDFFRFQLTSTSGCNINDTISFDNIRYYVGTNRVTKLPSDAYGTAVDTTLDKTLSSDNESTDGSLKAQYIEESYIMKIGTKRALKAGKRVNIFDGPLAGQYGDPVVIDGTVYLPLLPILDHMGFYYSIVGNSMIDVATTKRNSETGAVTVDIVTLPIGRDSALIDGEIISLTGPLGTVNTGLHYTDDNGDEVEATYLVIAMDDIERLFPGWYITYDNMGFIMLAEGDELLNRDTGLDAMVDFLKEFVYDFPTSSEITDEMAASTNNFDHPYLYGDDDDFDFLRSIYNKKYLLDSGLANEEFLAKNGLTLEYANVLQTIISNYVAKGSSAYVTYAVPDIKVNGNENHFFNSAGAKYDDSYYTNEIMYDKSGSFIHPYDDSVRGTASVCFAPMFTQKLGEGGKTWDLVIGEYVIATELASGTPKRNYSYDTATDTYVEVGEGNGIYDYVLYDFVDLKEPKRDYAYDSATQSYVQVMIGTGTHDLVGTDADGNAIYDTLLVPKNDYARKARFANSSYPFAYPLIDYFNFNTDLSNIHTYLEINRTNPTLCRACNQDHFGYDCVGARLESAIHIDRIKDIAFAYMITGELSYARLAYDLLDVIGSWQHWGPAHALNMCEAAGAYAIALDWIYDAVVEMSLNGETNYKGEPMDVKVLQNHLWVHGVGEDYVMSVLAAKTAYLRDNVDTPGLNAAVSSYYVDDTDNWGNVCNANTALAAMALLSYSDVLSPNSDFSKLYPSVPTGRSYASLAAEILELKFWCLPTYAAVSYAPEGEFIESPGYWGYGTNELLIMITALYNMVGHHYTLLDAPGYDKTFTYASYMESILYGHTYAIFNYNDNGNTISYMDSSYFFTAALALNKPELAKLRLIHLEHGKGTSYADVFMFRDAIKLASVDGDAELELDYAGTSIDVFTTRSSYDEEAPLFAAMIGGYATHNHSHLDNGSWIFYDKGTCWIVDIGSESYNVMGDTDYPSSSDWNPETGKMKLHNRYRYYRMSAEGHNTLIITSRQSTLPYGMNAQSKTRTSLIQIDEGGKYYYSDINGSYAKYDMKASYTALSGDEYAKSAYRGMLLTNGRRTLVIQDEIVFNSLEIFAWSAHIDASFGDFVGSYEISTDKKTVYLISDEGVCRMSIVSKEDDDRYSFEVRNTDPGTSLAKGVYLLNATFPIDSDATLGGDSQKGRSSIKNIVITPKNSYGSTTSVKSLNMAVVLETFDTMELAKNSPISYEYTPMSEWETYENGRYSDNLPQINDLRPDADDSDIFNVIIPTATQLELGSEFHKTYEIFNIYGMLTDASWAITGLGGAESFDSFVQSSAITITDAIAKYDSYVSYMNSAIDKAAFIYNNLI